MKPNPYKCHLLLSIQEEANIQIANKTIKSSKFKNLLGIMLEDILKFEKHNENIYQTGSRKLNAFERQTMELPKRCILMNALLKLSSIIVLSSGCFTIVL